MQSIHLIMFNYIVNSISNKLDNICNKNTFNT